MCVGSREYEGLGVLLQVGDRRKRRERERVKVGKRESGGEERERIMVSKEGREESEC